MNRSVGLPVVLLKVLITGMILFVRIMYYRISRCFYFMFGVRQLRQGGGSLLSCFQYVNDIGLQSVICDEPWMLHWS